MDELNSTYTVGWLVWLLMFGVIEGLALKNKNPGDTLTEHIKQWFALEDKPTGWKWRRGSLAVFFGWLVWHFFG